MADTKYLVKALELLERETPLGIADCGRLCGGACCKGDNGTGMWLFPGEAELLKDIDGFEIKETDGNFGYPMLVCSGACDRSLRPLACRIYPFFPVENDGHIRLIRDIRGLNTCPLVQNAVKPDRRFARAVRIAARYLMRDGETRAYMKNVQNELEEILNFSRLLGR